MTAIPPKPISPNSISCAELEEFFEKISTVSARETLPHFRNRLAIDNKLEKGFDPVTVADRQTELAIREEIEKRWPDHGIIGEEFSKTNEEAPYQWIIDPIDGTRAFISGIPVWGTLLGLYENGQPKAGLMVQPFTRERYFTTGQLSYLIHGDERMTLTTSPKTDLAQATLFTTDPALFNPDEQHCFEALRDQCQLVRYGTDCYAYGQLAAGNVELVIEAGLNIYDIAALIPIIVNAGGIVTDWQGNPCPNGGNVLAAANRALHEAALRTLNTI